MFREYDCFRLAMPLDDDSIPVGTVGVILMVYDAPHLAYEVEFPNEHGGNVGARTTYTITAEFMQPESQDGEK